MTALFGPIRGRWSEDGSSAASTPAASAIGLPAPKGAKDPSKLQAAEKAKA